MSDSRNRDQYDALVEKKRKGEEEEIYEEQLAEMTVTLAIAIDRLKNTPPDPVPTMDHLRALIKSKGTDPQIGGCKKQALQDIWDEVKDNIDWERDVFFDKTDQIEIEELEELLA